MSRNYKFHNSEGLYFVSFAVVFWIDVFIRRIYFECLVKNLNICVDNKGMEIYAWCIMPSHVHLVFRSTIQKPEELMRDFKSFTSKELIGLIRENSQESRKEWMMSLFEKAGKSNSNNTNFQFWRQDNHPIHIKDDEHYSKTLEYIHNNPVSSGLVEDPAAYIWSSAKDYNNKKGLIPVMML